MWCILGDFNVVRKLNERKGLRIGSSSKREMKMISDFMKKIEMLDVLIIGRKHTWYMPNGIEKSRLDRILVSHEWLEKWCGCKQHIHDRQLSDHCALMLKTTIVD